MTETTEHGQNPNIISQKSWEIPGRDATVKLEVYKPQKKLTENDVVSPFPTYSIEVKSRTSGESRFAQGEFVADPRYGMGIVIEDSGGRNMNWKPGKEAPPEKGLLSSGLAELFNKGAINVVIVDSDRTPGIASMDRSLKEKNGFYVEEPDLLSGPGLLICKNNEQSISSARGLLEAAKTQIPKFGLSWYGDSY